MGPVHLPDCVITAMFRKASFDEDYTRTTTNGQQSCCESQGMPSYQYSSISAQIGIFKCIKLIEESVDFHSLFND